MKRQSARISEQKTKCQKTDSLNLVKAVKNNSSFKQVKKIVNLGVNLEQEDEGKTALMYAFMYGNLQVATLLLSGGASVEGVDSDGNTVLMHAVSNMLDCDFIEKVLEKSSKNILSENNLGDTALLLACEKGDPDVVKILVQHGASVSKKNIVGDTPLIVAAKHGFSKVIKVLISAGADIEGKNILGDNALFEIRNLESLRVLLQSGADPYTVSEHKDPVIIHFIKSRCKELLEIIKLMFKVGVDPTAKDIKNKNSILMCLFNQLPLVDIEIIQYLLKETSTNPSEGNRLNHCALSVAISRGHIDAVKLLLNAGANPSSQDNFGTSLLMKATNVEILNILIQAGANVCASDDEGKTALMYAIQNRNFDYVKCLLEAGSDPKQRDKQLNSALSEVSKLGPIKHAKIIELVENASSSSSLMPKNLHNKILSLSSALEKKNRAALKRYLKQIEFFKDCAGKNALMKACELIPENVNLVELLIEHFAVLSAQDENGKTALMLAFEKNNFTSLKMLINAGANISRQDNTGTSLFMMACKSGNLEIVKLLLKHGVSSLIHNNKGETAAMLAASENHLNVLRFLLKHGACSCVHKDKEGNSVLSYVVKNRIQVITSATPSPFKVQQDFERTFNFIVQYGTIFDDVAIVTEVIRVYMKYLGEHHAVLSPFYIDFTQQIVNKATSLITDSTILTQHQRNINAMLMVSNIDFKYRSDIFYIIIKSVFTFTTGKGRRLIPNNYHYNKMIKFPVKYFETIGFLIDVCFRNCNAVISEELYDFYCTMIDNLINSGFPVNPRNPKIIMSPLIMVMGLMDTINRNNQIYILKLAQILINKGVSKCQFLLRFQRPEIDLLREKLQLPDALWIAFQSGHSTVLSLLTPYWSAPPLALFLFLAPIDTQAVSTLEKHRRSLSDCFDILLRMCGPLPPGNEHIPTIQLYLDTFANHYEPARPLALKFRTAHSDRNPPSLLSLCRYVIRGSSRSSDDLPERLSSLHIPETLKTYISFKKYVRPARPKCEDAP